MRTVIRARAVGATARTTRGHTLVALRWGPGGGPEEHMEEGRVALVICMRCGAYASRGTRLGKEEL